MSVSVSDCVVTRVSSERRQYLSIWEKSVWQLYLIFLLETIQLLEYLDLFEWKYYRNILSSGFLHGEEISFCSQNFVRGSQPLSQFWKTVGTHSLIKWKSSKEINLPWPTTEGPSTPRASGRRGTGQASVARRGRVSSKPCKERHPQDLLWGSMLGQTGAKWKYEHEMYVNTVSEGSKLLVREYCSNCAGKHRGFQRKGSTAMDKEKGYRILTCAKSCWGLFSRGITSGCCCLSESF